MWPAQMAVISISSGCAEITACATQVIDYGFPQSSSSEALKEFVLNEPIIVRGPVRTAAAARHALQCHRLHSTEPTMSWSWFDDTSSQS